MKTILFDLDGTLHNSIPLIRLSFEKTFAALGIPWASGEVLSTIGLPMWQVAKRYAPGREAEFRDTYSTIQDARQEKMLKPFPGTLETLAAIRAAGYRTGVVTSKRRGPALAALEFTGLSRFIEITVAVEDATRPKPDSEPVHKALELLETRPEQALFVGDSWFDIQAGKGAGVTTIAFTWGMATREQLSRYGPDHLVDSWDEFLALLQSFPPPLSF
ncbi:MAG: HAD-IA family hydrolase [Clostridia bacterium]|nr:HAD-IA family hydrolase [Clostridia bacterium]